MFMGLWPLFPLTGRCSSPDYDAEDGDDQARDARLMPPPPPAVTGTGTGTTPAAPSPSQKEKESKEPPRRKQLNTPLGAMLPEKYAGVEITDLFPDFREDKVGGDGGGGDLGRGMVRVGLRVRCVECHNEKGRGRLTVYTVHTAIQLGGNTRGAGMHTVSLCLSRRDCMVCGGFLAAEYGYF